MQQLHGGQQELLLGLHGRAQVLLQLAYVGLEHGAALVGKEVAELGVHGDDESRWLHSSITRRMTRSVRRPLL
jgi:hypothetical protein